MPKNKIHWIDKQEKFIWKYCPCCDGLKVEAIKEGYQPTEKDEKHIKELTKAIVFPHRFSRFAKKCKTDKWSKHIIFKENDIKKNQS